MYYLIGLLSIATIVEAIVLFKVIRDKRFLKFKYDILLKSFDDFIKTKNNLKK